MAEKKGKVHYAWYILAVCVILNMTVHTIVMQMGSFFTVPMYQDLQVPRTLLALQSVVIAAGAVITAPIWGKIYKKKDARYILALCTLMTGLTTIARGFMPNIIGILVVSAIKGIFFAGNTALPISILLTAWFQKKRGLAISIASLGISVGNVILSPIVARLISNFGWRTADKVLGLVMLVIMLPCALLVVRSSPKSKDMLPYGADVESANASAAKGQKGELSGMTIAQARKTPAFYIFLAAIFCMTLATGAALQLAAYLTDIGYDPTVAARVFSAYSAVAIVGKLALGAITDKFGEKKGSIYICTVGILAFACFMMARNQIFLYGLILFWGLGSGITSVLPTLLTSKIFGRRDYGAIYGTVVSINRLGGVIGNVLVSFLYDITKDYTIIWPMCLVCMVLTLVAILFCLNYASKNKSVESVSA